MGREIGRVPTIAHSPTASHDIVNNNSDITTHSGSKPDHRLLTSRLFLVSETERSNLHCGELWSVLRISHS